MENFLIFCFLAVWAYTIYEPDSAWLWLLYGIWTWVVVVVFFKGSEGGKGSEYKPLYTSIDTVNFVRDAILASYEESKGKANQEVRDKIHRMAVHMSSDFYNATDPKTLTNHPIVTAGMVLRWAKETDWIKKHKQIYKIR